MWESESRVTSFPFATLMETDPPLDGGDTQPDFSPFLSCYYKGVKITTPSFF